MFEASLFDGVLGAVGYSTSRRGEADAISVFDSFLFDYVLGAGGSSALR